MKRVYRSDLNAVLQRHERMGQLVQQNRGKKEGGGAQAHNPVLRRGKIALDCREVAFRHGIDHQEKNDKPRVINNYLDTANAE